MSFGANETKPIRVMIADDHPVVRKGLRSALSSDGDIEVIGEAVDGVEAVEKATQLKPDVAILDVYMPGQTGLVAMLRIKQSSPGVKVIILTVSELESDLLQAIRLGADGYLLKKSDISDVVNAVRKVVNNEAILSPRMTATVMGELRAEKHGFLSLSDREKEVLDLLAEGLTSTEIAGRLSLSKGSVSTYIYRLLQKLHLKNRAEAIAYSVQHRHHEPF